MMLRVVSVAEKEVAESALWLEQQQVGLGDDFLLAVERAFAEIKQAPLACPSFLVPDFQFKLPLRWRKLGRFPYVAIFNFQDQVITVVGVLHVHRNLEAILRSRVGQH